jgi:hypothetical protein
MANELFNALPEANFSSLLASAARVVLPPTPPSAGIPMRPCPAPLRPRFQVARQASAADAPAWTLRCHAGPQHCADLRPAAPPLQVSTLPGRGSAGGIAPTAGPAFAFLQDARPLFVEPDAEPAAQNTPSQPLAAPCPPTRDLRRFLRRCLPIFSLRRLLSLRSLPRPQFQALWACRFLGHSGFLFLEEARPLFSRSTQASWSCSGAGVKSGQGAAPRKPTRRLQQSVCRAARSERTARSRHGAHAPDFRAPSWHL